MQYNKNRLQKLAGINEVQRTGGDPYADFFRYCQANKIMIIEAIITIEGQERVEEYLGDDYIFDSIIEEADPELNDGEEGDFTVLRNSNFDNTDNECLIILLSNNVEEEFEGDGPVSGGVIFEVEGVKLQYQFMAC